MSEMKCKRCGADEKTDFTKEFIAEARESITEPGVERYICIPVQLEMLDEIERLQSRIAELEAERERVFDLVRELRTYCIFANWDNPDTEDDFNEFDVEVCKWLSKFMEREE